MQRVLLPKQSSFRVDEDRVEQASQQVRIEVQENWNGWEYDIDGLHVPIAADLLEKQVVCILGPSKLRSCECLACRQGGDDTVIISASCD